MTKAKVPKTKSKGECEFTFGDGKLPFTLDLTERKKRLMEVIGIKDERDAKLGRKPTP